MINVDYKTMTGKCKQVWSDSDIARAKTIAADLKKAGIMQGDCEGAFTSSSDIAAYYFPNCPTAGMGGGYTAEAIVIIKSQPHLWISYREDNYFIPVNEASYSLYVTMTDHFLSGWGCAAGRTAKMVILVPDSGVANDVYAAFARRDEISHVRICSNKPSYPVKTVHTSYKSLIDCIGNSGADSSIYYYTEGSEE